MKLIDPFDDTPHESGPSPINEETAYKPAAAGPDLRDIPVLPKGLVPRRQMPDAERTGVQAAGTSLADPGSARQQATSESEPQDAPGPLKGLKPLWQMAGEELPEDRPTGVLPPARRKSTIRYQAPRERAGSARQKMMTALIPILAIAMVLLFRHSLGARSTAKAAPAKGNETVPVQVPEIEIAWTVPPLWEFSNRDPMRLTPAPAAVAVENAEATDKPVEPPIDLALTGILYSGDKPAAIVDTQIVHEGQRISGATVEKIDRDGVQFERNGRRWKQTLSQ